MSRGRSPAPAHQISHGTGSHRRAVVSADGDVQIVEETPGQWLAENGLL